MDVTERLVEEVNGLHISGDQDGTAATGAFFDFISAHRSAIVRGTRREAAAAEEKITSLIENLNSSSTDASDIWSVPRVIGLAYGLGFDATLESVQMVRGCAPEIASLEQPARTSQAQRERWASFGDSWRKRLTADEAPAHNRTWCCICDDMIRNAHDPKVTVVEHCHLIGVVRGLAHRRCNSIEGWRNKPKSPFYLSYSTYYARFAGLEAGWSYYDATKLPRCAMAFNELVSDFVDGGFTDEYQSDATARWRLTYPTGRLVENLLFHSARLRPRIHGPHGIDEPCNCVEILDRNAVQLCRVRRGADSPVDARLAGGHTPVRSDPVEHSCPWCPG